jgi:hypothetical protein
MSQVPDTFGCMSNTIKVAAGHYVDLANPDPITIDLTSIAAALGKICRFGGQCPRFYSVAEHCVHAARLAYECGESEEAVKAVLLHDAAEAYIGDMVKPLKIMLSQYSEVEQRIERAIQKRFGVDFATHHEAIKTYDRAIFKAEKVAMWPTDAEIWPGFDNIEDRDVALEYWGPGEAECEYRNVARLLGLFEVKDGH